MANPNPVPLHPDYRIGGPKGIKPGRQAGVKNKRRVAGLVVVHADANADDLKAAIEAVFKIAKDKDHPKQLDALRWIDEQLDGVHPKDVRIDINHVREETRRQLAEWGEFEDEPEDAEYEVKEGENGSNGKH